ncbi:MAG TPA: hypothetical protein VIG64_02015 [Actinomycetota bacterium]|jgi:hypothetical protein
MVTTIDPVVHGGRTRTYVAAIVLHVLGATAAATAFGAALGGLGAVTGAPWGAAGLRIVVVVAALYLLREAAGVPVPLPDRKRQVPEWWRTFYSAPVTALLYGFGLGIGFMTFLTFGTFVAVAVVALASGDVAAGALVCGPFGLARGLSVLVAARAGGRSALDRLERASATPEPRLVNALALAGVGVAGVLALG